MSKYDYTRSKELSGKDLPFYAIIMMAMRRADDVNLEKLKSCWPDVWNELTERYWSANGLLVSEGGAPSQSDMPARAPQPDENDDATANPMTVIEWHRENSKSIKESDLAMIDAIAGRICYNSGIRYGAHTRPVRDSIYPRAVIAEAVMEYNSRGEPRSDWNNSRCHN